MSIYCHIEWRAVEEKKPGAAWRAGCADLPYNAAAAMQSKVKTPQWRAVLAMVGNANLPGMLILAGNLFGLVISRKSVISSLGKRGKTRSESRPDAVLCARNSKK